MKQFISKFSGVKLLGWVALSAILFSFSGMGGESYTIHMGDKLLLQQHVTVKAAVPGFTLQKHDADKELYIYYNHCGQIGKSRSIAIKDEQNKVLKEWKYTDAVSEHNPMTCKVKEILSLQRNAGNKVQLVYSSKEIPGGKVLASVTLPIDGVVSRK